MGLGNLQDSGSSLTHASAFLPRGSAVASVWASSPPLKTPHLLMPQHQSEASSPCSFEAVVRDSFKEQGFGQEHHDRLAWYGLLLEKSLRC